MRQFGRRKSEGDFLWMMKIIAVDFFHHPISVIIYLNIIIGMIILQVVETFYFMQKFDGRYFVKYSSAYIGIFYVLVTSISYPIICKAVLQSVLEIQIFKMEIAPVYIKNRIKKEAFYFNVMVVVNSIISVYSTITYIIPNKDDPEIFFGLALANELVPEWSFLVEWSARLSFIHVSLIMSAPFYIVMYLALHAKFQAFILLRYVRSINSGYEDIDEELLLRHEKYHQKIKKRLKFCIHSHRKIYTAGNRLLKKLSTLIMLYFVSGIILGVAIMVFYFSYRGLFSDKKQRVVSLCIACGVTFIHIIWTCQQLEDVTTEFYETLKRQKWYCWSAKNKKIFLIFSQICKKPFQVKFSENISVNYGLGISLMRSVYSMASVLRKLKQIDI